ncbi:MAG: FG-GAP repeat protein [Phycisphaerae bacterium]|nr:FG-GAP repeat protein [Phycisphaerae bacterium]
MTRTTRSALPVLITPAALLSGAVASLLPGVASADVLTLLSTTPSIGGRFGDAVACIGDVNADGYNDVLVGGPVETGGGIAGSGRAVVFSGRTGTVLRTHLSPSPIVQGAFGQSVIGFPDINGDGIEEYAIGAPREASSFGRLHVFSGATGVQLYSVDGLAPLTFMTIALIPDCTGDGSPEFIGGVFGNLTSTPAEVREAKNGVLWKTLVDPVPQNTNLFGKAVGGVPDVTGDGLGDVLVGAERAEPPSKRGPTPEDAGRVYVYDGATGALVRTLLSHDQTESGHFGQTVAGLPDIDGDGRGEIVVGAPFEGPANGWDGRVHIHSGASGAWIRTILTSDPAPFSGSSGEFGFALDTCPDLDGDGAWDIVIGAPEEVISASETGRAYSYSSQTGVLIASYQAPGSLAKRFGHALDASRDVNGDGSPDLIVGAPNGAFGTIGPVGFACLFRLVPGDGCAVGTPPVVVGDGTHAFTTVGAALDFPLAPLCGADEQFFVADVFYEYVATCTGTLQVSTCGSADFDTTIALYQGCGYGGGAAPSCDAGNLIACNADTPGCPNGTSVVAVPTNAVDCYRIRIGGPGGGSGTFTVSCTSTCPADLDHDGMVGATDLAIMLGAWESAGPADLDGSGKVAAPDIALLLGAWGGC